MKNDLLPLKLMLNKQAYLDMILNCCEFDYDENNEIMNMTYELSKDMPEDYFFKLIEFETLVKDKVIKAIAGLDCVKIIFDN